PHRPGARPTGCSPVGPRVPFPIQGRGGPGPAAQPSQQSDERFRTLERTFHMRQWASAAAKSLLLAAGFVALGSGVAFADSGAATSGNGSVLGGNQAVANADVPVNLSGNAISALGVSGANATDTEAEVEDHGDSDV